MRSVSHPDSDTVFLYKQATQSLSLSTVTKVSYDGMNGRFNPKLWDFTNHRYTALRGGVYQIGCQLVLQGSGAGVDGSSTFSELYIRKNGTDVAGTKHTTYLPANTFLTGASIMQNLSAGDYIETYALFDKGNGTWTIGRVLGSGDTSGLYGLIISRQADA